MVSSIFNINDLLKSSLLKRLIKLILQYDSGLVTRNGERYKQRIDIWGKTGDEVGKAMMEQLIR